MHKTYNLIRRFGALLLVAIVISLVGSGIAYAGGRSGTVERMVNSTDDRDNKIMPVPASSGAGATHMNSLLSDADAINSKIYEASRELGQKAADTVRTADDNKLPLIGQRGGDRNKPVSGQSSTITYVEQGSIDKSKATSSQTQNWGGYNYEILTIDGQRYILAGFGVPEGTTQSMQVIQQAMNNAQAGDKILVKGGQYGDGTWEDGKFKQSSSSEFDFKSNVSLYGGYNEDGTRDIVNNATVFNGAVGMATAQGTEALHNCTLDGVQIYCTFNTCALYVDRGYGLIISNNTITSRYNENNDGRYANQPWYQFSSCIKFHDNNDPRGEILLKNNNLISNDYIYWDHGRMSRNTPIWDMDNKTEGPLYGGVSSGPLTNMQDHNTNGQKGVAPIKESRETTTTNSTNVNKPYLPGTGDDYLTGSYKLFEPNTGKTYDTGKIYEIFIEMLKNNDAFTKDTAGKEEPSFLDKFALTKPIGDGTLAAPAETLANFLRERDLEIAGKLAGIMLNPTEEQKAIINAVDITAKEAEMFKYTLPDEEFNTASKEFSKAVSIVLFAQAMPGLFAEGDLAALSKAMSFAAESQKDLYNKYLSETESIYDQLAKLMGVYIDKLPQDIAYFSNLSDTARKKLAVDMAVEKLAKKDPNTLSENEQKALKIVREELAPKRAAYLNELKDVLSSFVSKVNEVLKNREATPVKEGQPKNPIYPQENPIKS